MEKIIIQVEKTHFVAKIVDLKGKGWGVHYVVFCEREGNAYLKESHMKVYTMVILKYRRSSATLGMVL